MSTKTAKQTVLGVEIGAGYIRRIDRVAKALGLTRDEVAIRCLDKAFPRTSAA